MKGIFWLIGIFVVVLVLLVIGIGSVPNDEILNDDSETESGDVENSPVETTVDEKVVVDNLISVASSGATDPSATFTLTSIEARDWPNSCLGAAENDEVCAEVITPGYRVVLKSGGASFVYHTDLTGGAIRLKEVLSN